MTDWGQEDRQQFLRRTRYLGWLRGLYVVLVGLSIGGALACIINLFTRKTP